MPAGVRKSEQITSLQAVVEQGPDVQEQKINAGVAALQLEQTLAGRLPSINLESFLGANNLTFNLNPVTGWYGNAFIGLSIRYNLFNSGQKKNQIEQSRIELEQQKENVRKLGQQAYYEILKSRKKIQTRVKQVDLQQQRLKVQEEKIVFDWSVYYNPLTGVAKISGRCKIKRAFKIKISRRFRKPSGASRDCPPTLNRYFCTAN
jgi:hypothetical protein